MKKLNVRFSETQELRLSDVSDKLNISVSDIARAAMYIGLNEIVAASAQSVDRGIEFASLNAVKAK